MAKTREELVAIAKTHAASEAAGDIEATLATLDSDPLYELASVGLAFRGRANARRYYEHFFATFQPQIASYELRNEWVSDEGVGQEYAIHLRLADGGRESHGVIGILCFGDDALAGERVYASERLLRLMFGPLLAEAERRGRISLRPAEVSDAAELGRVHVAAWRAAYAGILSDAFLAKLDEQESAQGWARGFRANPGVTLVEVDGRVAGFCRQGVSRDGDAKPSTGELMAINLHPHAWQRGAGSVLLADAERRLRAAGFTEATLWVFEQNARARAFYETRAWRPDGATRVDPILAGEFAKEVRYRKQL